MNVAFSLEISSAMKEMIGRLAYAHSPLSIGLLGLAATSVLAGLTWRDKAATQVLSISRRLLPIAATLFVIGAVGLFVLNGVFPAFRFYIELQSAFASYLLSKGFPLYHGAESPERYSVLYGPTMYLLVTSSFRLLGASIFTAKLPLTVLLLGMTATAASIFRSFLSAPIVALAVFLLVLAFEILTCSPIIILSALVAYYAYYLSRWQFRPWVVGLCLGVACGTKIHSGLYFLPILFDMLWQRRFLDLVFLGLTSIVVLGGPFLLPGIDLRGYIWWLRAATAHGLSLAVLANNLDWLAFQLAVLFASIVFIEPRFATEDGSRSTFFHVSTASRVGAALAALGTLAIASKPGAGFHHLFPLLPALAILIGPFAQSCRARAAGSGRATLLSAGASIFLLGMLIFHFLPLARFYYEFHQIPALPLRTDLREIVDRNPSARIVIGSTESALGEYMSKAAMQGQTMEPLLLFAGHPFLYDTSALFDMQASHLPIPSGTINRLRDGSIDIWLFPKGRQPFQITNPYDMKTPLFPPEFREAFLANYSWADTSTFYDIWRYHGAGRGAK